MDGVHGWLVWVLDVLRRMEVEAVGGEGDGWVGIGCDLDRAGGGLRRVYQHG